MFFSHPQKRLIQHYNEMLSDNQDKYFELIVKCHDFGKYNEEFQNKISDKKYNEYLSHHSLLSSIFTYYVLNKNNYSKEEKVLGCLLVLNHHNRVKGFQDIFCNVYDDNLIEEQLKIIKKHVEEIQKDIKQYLDVNVYDFVDFVDIIVENINDDVDELLGIKDKIKELHVKFMTYFPKLIYLDRKSAGNIDFKKEDLKFNGIYIKNEKSSNDLYNKLLDIRESVKKEALNNLEKINLKNNKILKLNAFTGAGKTLTSLEVALKIREKKGENSRIIYALPFVNIIEQTYDVFKNIFGDDIKQIIKSYYLNNNYKAIKEDNNEDIIKELIDFIYNNFESNVVVTTTVKLFSILYSNRNSDLVYLNNLRNSVIVLDEVQSLPVEFWSFIEELLNYYAENYNIHFLIMSATLPKMFENRPILADVKYERLPQKRANVFFKSNINEENFIELFQEIYNKYNSILIISNTIKESQVIIKQIKEYLNGNDGQLFYISNSITPYEKQERIKKVIKKLKNKEKVVVVSTQVVEAGVDFSFECVVRDLAPVDSIVQAIGRCNRSYEYELGYVYIFNAGTIKKVYKEIHKEITEEIFKEVFDSKEIINDKDDFDYLIQLYYERLSQKYKYLQQENKENYMEYFWTFDKQMSEFNIIKEKVGKQPVYVLISGESKRLFQKYKMAISRENKKLIWKEMNKYIVNTYVKNIQEVKIDEIEELGISVTDIDMGRYDGDYINSLEDDIDNSKVGIKVDSENQDYMIM